MPRSVLMIFIEPTPYNLGFIRAVARRPDVRVESMYITANRSQPWNLDLTRDRASLLPPAFLAAALDIARRIASRRFNVLHLAGWGEPLLMWALLVGWVYRIPTFMESDTQLSPGVPAWKRLLKRMVYPWIFKIPRVLLPAGNRQAAYFRHYGVRDNRIVKAQMSVDVVEISRKVDRLRATRDAEWRRGLGLREDQTIFLYLGRLDARKGIRTLLEAFESAAPSHPEMALVIAGDGDERHAVEAVASRVPSLKFVGRLDSEQVLTVLSQSDAAVVPGITEQWGLVVNEAMAAGLPVIAADGVGCVDDLVQHGVTGFIVGAGDAAGLGDAMMQLAADQEMRSRMGKAGRCLIDGWTLDEQARIAATVWTEESNSRLSWTS